MHPLTHLLQTWSEFRARREAAVLATVVAVSGSACRRPGARMLIGESLDLAGGVSGGCLEDDLLRRAWWRVERHGAHVCRYDGTDEEFALDCEGVVDVLLERLDPVAEPAWLVALREAWSRRQPFSLATGLRPAGARAWLDLAGRLEGDPCLTSPSVASALREAGRSHRATFASVTAFIELVAPPPRVVLFGAGRDAVPLAAICEGQGWDVSVVDPRRTPAPRGRFNCPVRSVDEVALDRDMLCVVMTHNLSVDREIVHGLLDSPVRYIGVLGPRRRTERILAERGASVGDVRIHAPVGLDLGAEGPAGVALSVAAELQAFVSGRCGGSLRDGHVPIHSEAALPAGVGDTPSVPSV